MCDSAHHNWKSVFVGEDAAAGEELIHEGAGREQNGFLVWRGLVQQLRGRDLQLPLYRVCELQSYQVKDHTPWSYNEIHYADKRAECAY
jgi:hypothetical protein